MGATKDEVFDQYIQTLIRSKARQLVGRFGFTGIDQSDIEQDLALHLLEHIHAFDPTRGSKRTYAARIVDRKIASMLRWRYAQQRDCRRSVPLEETFANESNDARESVDRRRPRIDPNPDLAIDVASNLVDFDGDRRHLCELLKHESIAGAARRLNLTRGQGRSWIAKIRSLLTDRGLDAYINPETAERPSDRVSNQ